MRKLPIIAAFLFASLITSALCDPQPGQERTWTGMNGKTFLGVFARTFEDGGKKAQFIGSTGKTVTVAFDNLSEKDREIILVFEGKAPAKPAPVAALTEDSFRKLPVADRKIIPMLKPEDFGGRDDESFVDSLWVSLLWWDAAGIMPVPKSGDTDRKAKWLHKELTSILPIDGRSAVSLEEAESGVKEYFEKRLEDTGTCKAVILRSVDADSLSRLAKGNSIVVLKMKMTYSNEREYSQTAALESMEPDGTFVMHMFGRRFTGKMTARPGNVKPAVAGEKAYVISLNNPEAMPDHYRTQEATFSIGVQAWNGALVLDPLVYKESGKEAPDPGDK
jgi:hypothetical protein